MNKLFRADSVDWMVITEVVIDYQTREGNNSPALIDFIVDLSHETTGLGAMHAAIICGQANRIIAAR